MIVWLLNCLIAWLSEWLAQSNYSTITHSSNISVVYNPGSYLLPLTLLSAASRVIYSLFCEGLRHLSSTFPYCHLFVSNVTLCAFRTRCCVVLYPIVFRYVSLIFPFVKRKQKGKRSNNERINDDAWWSLERNWLDTFLRKKESG